MTTWAFVDYENTGTLETIDLGSCERVIVFCGPQDKLIKFGSLLTDGCGRIEVIGVAEVGRNNLDFHLACYLGRFHETARSDVRFHVISNDKGFDGLLVHLKANGRPCKRVHTKPVATKPVGPKPAKKKTTKNAAKKKPTDPRERLTAAARDILNKLAAIPVASRPQSLPKLINWVKNHLNGHTGIYAPEEIVNELITATLVRASGSDFSYALNSKPTPLAEPASSDPAPVTSVLSVVPLPVRASDHSVAAVSTTR